MVWIYYVVSLRVDQFADRPVRGQICLLVDRFTSKRTGREAYHFSSNSV